MKMSTLLSASALSVLLLSSHSNLCGGFSKTLEPESEEKANESKSLEQLNEKIFALIGGKPTDANDSLEDLLFCGADPNARCKNEKPFDSFNTALMAAIFLCHINKMPQYALTLLDHGADPNDGAETPAWFPLSLAVHRNQLEVVQKLLNKGAKPELENTSNKYVPLLCALAHPNLPMARLLVDHGAAVPTRVGYPHITTQAEKWPILKWAMSAAPNKGALVVPAVREILKYEAECKQRLKSETENTEIAESIIKAEVPHDTSNAHYYLLGLQVIALLGKKIDYDALDALINAGANLNAMNLDAEGLTPLVQAMLINNWELVEKFIKKGANPNLKSKNGWTPLCSAAYFGSRTAIELLLRYGAELNQNANPNPVKIAVQNYQWDTAHYLLCNGGVLPTDFNGLSPIEYAVKKQDYEMLQFFIDHGVEE